MRLRLGLGKKKLETPKVEFRANDRQYVEVRIRIIAEQAEAVKQALLDDDPRKAQRLLLGIRLMVENLQSYVAKKVALQDEMPIPIEHERPGDENFVR